MKRKEIIILCGLFTCCFNIVGCNKNDKLKNLLGSDVSNFDLKFSRKTFDAEVFRFDGNRSDITRFAKKFNFDIIKDGEYRYAELNIDSPYFIRRKNNGTFVLVIGKISGENFWSLLVVDY